MNNTLAVLGGTQLVVIIIIAVAFYRILKKK